MSNHLSRGTLLLSAVIALASQQTSMAAESPLPVSLFNVPALAGSSSPRLAAAPGGDVVLSWLEPHASGHALKYSKLSDAAWAKPREVARGANWFVNWADFPSVVPIGKDLWAAHWLVSQPAGGYAYDVLLSLSGDGGKSWTEPVMPHDDGTATEHGFVTLFARPAGVGLIWLDGRNTLGHSADSGLGNGMTLRSAEFGSDLIRRNDREVDDLVCDCCQTDAAVAGSGPVAIYRDRTEDETRDIYVSRYLNGAWTAGIPVANDNWTIGGCPVNGPVIAADGNRVAAAWFTGANGRARIQVARSHDSGATFAPSLDVVSGDTVGRVGLALLPQGDLAVSFLCQRSDGRADVCLRLVSSDDRLGPVHHVSAGQQVPAMSVPQMEVAGAHLLLAWTTRTNGAFGIQSAHIDIAALQKERQ